MADKPKPPPDSDKDSTAPKPLEWSPKVLREGIARQQMAREAFKNAIDPPNRPAKRKSLQKPTKFWTRVYLLLKKYAGWAFVGAATVMAGLGEYAVGMALLVLAFVSFAIQIYEWSGHITRRWLVALVKGVWVLGVVGMLIFFAAVFYRTKGPKPWSNLLADPNQGQTVNTNPSTTPSSEPTFAENVDRVKITVGGNDAIYSVSDLQTPHQWPTSPRLPLVIYVKDKKPYVDATVYSGAPMPMELKGNSLVSYPPGWDYNLNSDAIEIVNNQHLPVFQLIYNRPNHIIIKGIFVVRNELGGFHVFVASESGLVVNPTNAFSLQRIFKYPSWQHRGEYETR